MDKKDGAWELYKAGYSQKRIAEMFDVSEQTITAWKKDGNWDKKLAQEKELWQTNAEMVGKLIAYQLKTLNKMVESWEKESETESGKFKLIGKGETDSLSKLYATIKRSEITWANYINVMKEFVEHLNREDYELAKVIIEHVDAFLNSKRAEL